MQFFNKNQKVVFHTRKQMERNRKKKYIFRFTIAGIFILFFAVLLILMQYDFDLSAISKADPEKTVSGENAGVYPESVSGQANFMLYGMDDDKSELIYLSIVNADLDINRITIFTFDLATQAFSYNGKTGSAYDCYKFGGVSMLKKSCEDLLSIKIDRYLGSDRSGILNALANFDSLAVEIPKDVTLTRNTEKVQFPSGTRYLDSEQAMKYLTYSGWASSEDKTEAHNNTIKAMLKQFIQTKYIEKSSRIFSNIINLTESDISMIDIREHADALKFLANGDVDTEYRTVSRPEDFSSVVKGE